MEFRILGPLEVIEDGQAVDMGGQKQRVLLAALLIEPNRVVSADRLIEALWPERPPDTASKALQVYVSQLRKTLGKARVETRSPGYLLRVGDDELDLYRCRLLAEQGETREALALWRGSTLSDFAYEPFAQSEIARIEALRLGYLEDRIEQDLAGGRQADLAGELECLVTAHPLRETFRRQLMLVLYRSGRQAEALEVYQRARRTLVEELGIEPSRELRELHQAVLKQDPALDLALSVSAGAEAESSRGPFVGREQELAELTAGLDDAFAGRGRLFLLVGEPGIGKSRLAEELMARARARGAGVLVGRCWEAGGAPAYWPWLQLLRAHVENGDPNALRSQLGGGAAEVAQIVPEIRELFPELRQLPLEVEGARLRLFDSVARFITNASTARPLVLVLDDLHVADEPSLLLLRFVAGELGSARTLVVGTYRDVDPTLRDPLASTLTELAREPITRRLELGGLAQSAVADYVEQAAGATRGAEVAAAIRDETGGNPLFVGELVRLLVAEGLVEQVDGPTLWKVGIPQGIHEVIGRRLRRLTEECVQILTLASVLGREFALDALQQVSAVGGDELLDLLDEAVAARLLTSVPGAHGRLRFAHALIRETLYEGLSTPRRVQLHRRVGDALEALYANDPEPHLAELAYHFFEGAPGGDVEKALMYARRAGDRALDLLAYEEAARLYGLALQAFGSSQSPGLETRYELLFAQGEALSRCGSTTAAKEAFVSAADLARTSGSPQDFARAALGYGGLFPWLRAGDDRRLVPLLEEALDRLGVSDPQLRVRLLGRLAGALRDQPSLEPRSSLSREAVETARALGDSSALGYALASYFTATWGPEIEQLDSILVEMATVAAEAGDIEREVDSTWLRRIVALSLGDVDEVERAAADHRALAEQLRQPSQLWYDAVMRSTWMLFRGDLEACERLAQEALRLGEQAQSWDARFSYRITLFCLRREQGRLREVEELARRTADEYKGYRSFRCLLVLFECELERPETARPELERLAVNDFAALPRDGEWIFCLSVLSEVAAHLQDAERAETLYRLLGPYAHLNAVAAGEIAIGSVARYLGLLAAALARWDDAEHHFEAALEMNERMGAKPWAAHTRRDYGHMLAVRDATGDSRRAEELLAAAATTYTELGMKGALARLAATEAR
jgi:DNA-binding SARP family transcriptional activator